MLEELEKELTVVNEWRSLACVQGKLEELEKELTVINENSERLKKSEAELIELQLVLQKAAQFFDEARVTAHGNTAGDSDAVTSVDVPLLDDAPVRIPQKFSQIQGLGTRMSSVWCTAAVRATWMRQFLSMHPFWKERQCNNSQQSIAGM
jgi:hypothetical protein